MEKNLSQFEGKYLGFAPTDKSNCGIGEIEITITPTVIKSRMATGLKIQEEEINVSDFQLTANEIKSELPKDTEATTFKNQGLDFPELIFLKNPEGSGLLVNTGGMGEMLSPTILFSPECVERGDFEKAVSELENEYGKGVLPRLRNDGRAEEN